MQTPPIEPNDLDTFLLSLLEDDVLALMLAPARVPAFAAETVRPEASK